MTKVKELVQKAEVELEKVEQQVEQKVEEEFNQSHALQVLINAVKVAQKRGAYELEETEIILKSIKMFIQQKV